MNIHSKERFRYTDEAWNTIRCELGREGIVADDAVTDVALLFTWNARLSLKGGLEFAASQYLLRKSLDEATAELDREIIKLRTQIKRVEECIDSFANSSVFASFVLPSTVYPISRNSQ